LTSTRWLTSTFLFLLGAACFGSVCVLDAISIARSPGFPQLIFAPYNRVQDFAFTLDHADCELLIYGDSSAMTGDDPASIELQTQLKTCNISQTQPIVVAEGALPIDLYLKQNTLPKFLIIQVAPEAFYQSHRWDEMAAFDPISLRLRHDAGWGGYLMLLEHVPQALQFTSLVLQDRYTPDRVYGAAFNRDYAKALSDYYSSRGLLTLPKPAETACEAAKGLPKGTDFGWVEAARKKYSAEGVKVLVTVSPIPECDPQLAIFRRDLAGHIDGEVRTLPISFFNDGNRHFTREGATVVSQMVVQEIQSAAAR
jgi:hypothetical protein